MAEPSHFVSAITFDRLGIYGSEHSKMELFGMKLKNNKINLIEHIEEDISSRNGLKSSIIYDIYEGNETNEDIIWVGTRDAGVHSFSH